VAAVSPAVETIVATPTPVTAAPTSTTPKTYVIAVGDTVSSIAAKFGVTAQAILTANGLNWSSIIYSGRTITIPSAASAVPQSSSAIVPLTAEMKANAQIIVNVGRSLGVPSYGLVIALAAAAQESGLRNLDFGDRDSLGLFQQRPSAGWGTPTQLLDPTYASRLFFGGPSNPNAGVTRGLLDIPDWQSMSVTNAAQAVQLSGHPTAYAKWEASARSWVSALS
jgi:LysM repeat protein